MLLASDLHIHTKGERHGHIYEHSTETAYNNAMTVCALFGGKSFLHNIAGNPWKEKNDKSQKTKQSSILNRILDFLSGNCSYTAFV